MNPDDEYAERLRGVLRAEADAVVPAGDGLARIRERVTRKGVIMRWIRPLAVLGAAAVVAGAVAAGIALTGNNGTRLRQAPVTGGQSSAPVPTPTPTAAAPPVGPAALTLPAGLPLWPFADGAAARQWAEANCSATCPGTPQSAALSFTTQHLGFTDDNLVVATTKSSDGQQAWVSIGYHTEGTRTATAAVVHLVRWGGTGPWEVVGTRDTTLTLQKPSYGATATSPVTAGGQITGVDESIRVAVHEPSSDAPLGVGCCTPAGGNKSPWSESVSYRPSTASVLTIVASTGGHLIAHERWALTAVRNSPAGPGTTPSTFVGVSQQRIGVFRTSDGSRVRWLTAAVQPGDGVSDPQVVGKYVYFLRGLGTCADALARVPYAGGSQTAVYTAPVGTTVCGYGVNALGQVALTLARGSDNAQRLYVFDPATGRSHSTSYAPQPPSVQNNPAWTPDNTHLVLVVRTGNLAQVYVVDAFTATSIQSGTVPCGGQAINPDSWVFYDGTSLDLAFSDGGPVEVATCFGGSQHRVHTATGSTFALAGVDGVGSSAGNLIVGGADQLASRGEDVFIWSGDSVHRLQLPGISQPTW